jgi:regulatory protein
MARFGTSAGGRRGSPADADREPDVDRDPGPDADPDSVAHRICLQLLTGRARTRAELADALQAREVPDDAASRVLDRLARVRLIDDQAFAANFVQSRHHDRGLSVRELSRQLRAKGVEESLVDEAIAELDPDRERDTARQLVERKLRSMSRLEPQVQTRRLVGMLARKGYQPGMAFQLVREVIGAQAAELEDGDTAWLA